MELSKVERKKGEKERKKERKKGEKERKNIVLCICAFELHGHLKSHLFVL